MPKTLFAISLILLLVLPACSSDSNGAATEPPAVIADEAPAAILNGTWSGDILDINQNVAFPSTLVITQASGDINWTGVLTYDFNGTDVLYNLTGTLNGENFEASEPEGRTFWGTVSSGVMDGFAGWNCVPCDGWGQYTLTQNTP